MVVTCMIIPCMIVHLKAHPQSIQNNQAEVFMTTEHKQPICLAQIVAVSKNHCIGKDNDLPWHISADLQHFKRMTTHRVDDSDTKSGDDGFNGVMVMGRKTFESMRSRPLPKRVNIIVTRKPNYVTDKGLTEWVEQGKIVVVHHLDEALTIGRQKVRDYGLDTLWVIGGGDIFRQVMPITDRIELTSVDVEIDGDAFYPDIPKHFQLVQQSATHTDDKTGMQFQFLSYRKSVMTETNDTNSSESLA